MRRYHIHIIFLRCNMIFDIHINNFKRKSWYVAGKHMTKNPSYITYGRVVSRERFCIALMMVALNVLDVFCKWFEKWIFAGASDQEYLDYMWAWVCSRQCQESHYLSSALRDQVRRICIKNHVDKCMSDLDYYSWKEDPDVWMRACTNPDRNNFYEYILFYVDNVLCINNNPREAIARIYKLFPMQPDLIEKPDMYLGAKVYGMVLPNGVIAWELSARKYSQ